MYQTLDILTPIQASQNPCKVGAEMIPILQMTKLRLRELHLAKVLVTRKGKGYCLSTPELSLSTPSSCPSFPEHLPCARPWGAKG